MGAVEIAILVRSLRAQADPAQAAAYMRFFKTGAGEYGEGDRFLGVRVPMIRAIAKRGAACSVAALTTLLRSPWHEKRMLALLSLVNRYRDADDLIHKAVGWMLREVGKRCDRDLLRAFLDEHRARMPRTMLRYAIEHFPERERQRYLARA